MATSDFLPSGPAPFLLRILPKEVLQTRGLLSMTASGTTVQRQDIHDYRGTDFNDTGDSQSSVINDNSIMITRFVWDNHTGSPNEEIVMALMFNE